VRAIDRVRLRDLLGRVWQHRLALIVAPAGSGKTTLLAQFVGSTEKPSAWYRAEAPDAEEPALVAHLERACASAVPNISTGRWRGIDDVIAFLERWPADGGMIAIDDAHTIRGTPAERALEKLVDYLPPHLHLVIASRRPPSFNLSRLRVSDALLELGADDLRFRSWEVEALFCDLYGEPLPPEDLAELARRTEGWAAGLQLFHLATRGKSWADRRRVLASLGGRSRMVREYLARNVVDELPVELRSFVKETCVLGRLSASLCDELTGRSDSARRLEELEARQVFTVALEDGVSYRYHEAFRAHLEALLVEQVGDEQARQRYGRAGALLEAAHAPAEALRAFARAEDWTAVARLLGRDGAEVADQAGALIDGLPAALVDNDPWLMLAAARRLAMAGRLPAAVELYQRAERAFGSESGADLCRAERRMLALWLGPRTVTATDWVSLLRLATQRDPLSAAEQLAALPGAFPRLAEGVALLLGGRWLAGRTILRRAQETIDAPAAASAVAVSIALFGLPGSLRGSAAEFGRSVDNLERCGLPWLAQLARGALALAEGAGAELSTAVDVCDAVDDGWGGALALLMRGIAGLGSSPERLARSPDDLASAAAGFHDLGAPVLEAWARSWQALALAELGSPDAGSVAESACGRARAVRSPGPIAVGDLARARAGAGSSAAAVAAMRELGLDFDDRVLALSAQGAPLRTGGEQATSLQLFGGFRLVISGRVVDLKTVKPRARAVLHLLALRAGQPVHREILAESLWPEVGPNTATRNLHVAVSAVRQALEPGVARGDASVVVRDGDAYRLILPPSASVDVADFDRAWQEARNLRVAGDVDGAASSLERLLDIYRGDLLPEDGPAEWVVKLRDRYRMQAADSAELLARHRFDLGLIPDVIQACERGLRVDQYRDGMWRLLATSHERSGDRAAAVRAERAYRAVLVELDL
jgi:DNA-binding SARP family transcriptional activator